MKKSKEKRELQERVERAIIDYIYEHGEIVSNPELEDYFTKKVKDPELKISNPTFIKYMRSLKDERKLEESTSSSYPITKFYRINTSAKNIILQPTSVSQSDDKELKQNNLKNYEEFENIESQFVAELKKIPTISFADFELNCQSIIYKTETIQSNPTKFLDYLEGNSIELTVNNDFPTVKLDEELFDEIREYNRDVAGKIEKDLGEGLQGYPRLVRLPVITKKQNLKNLSVELGNCDFGITLLGALHANGKVKSVKLDTIKKKFQLGNIGVRILLIYNRDGKTKALFHERGKKNSGYVGAWDATAAGYVNPQDCLDADTQKLSVWKASKLELVDELRLGDFGDKKLPHREEYWYYDILRETTTETFDIVGLARRSVADDAYNIEEINKNVKSDGYVQKVEECNLEPIAIAHFIKEKKYWVPGGIYAAVLALHVVNKISIDNIEKIFKEEKVFSDGDVSVEAYR